jgi:hypothetical protein
MVMQVMLSSLAPPLSRLTSGPLRRLRARVLQHSKITQVRASSTPRRAPSVRWLLVCRR